MRGGSWPARALLPRRPLLLLALPFAFLVLPLAAGFDWVPIGPQIPEIPNIAAYAGRRPNIPVTIEYYGSGVVVVPFRAHMRALLASRELPLWNPEAALGQPLAAQGEGSPYSPLAILRALLPATWATSVTIGLFAVSAVALFGFLRLLGLSEASSVMGGASWALSGALTLEIGRDNIADQLSLIPPLFLAAAWAIRARRVSAYATFSAVVCLHTLAGFLQIAVNAYLVLAGFVVVFTYLQPGTIGRARTLLAMLGFTLLGLALASPYTLPIADALQDVYNKNSPFLAFLPMPSANVVSFVFPLLFGPLLNGWLDGAYPDVTDWNNLFAFCGCTLVFLTIVGLASVGRQPRCQRVLFLFFVAAGLFLLGRYVSFPLVAGISFLPILNQQSPKHTNGVTVFCLVVSAAMASGWLRQTNVRRAAAYIGIGLVAMTSTMLTLVGRQGGLSAVDADRALIYVAVTVAIAVSVLLTLWRASRAKSDADAARIVAALAVAELSIYLPLGNSDPVVLGGRVVVAALIALAGLLLVGRWRLMGYGSGALGLALYLGIILVPSEGLPTSFDVEAVPEYLAWTRAMAGHDYRAFGVQPDYAALAGIQDIEAVGPLATPEYMRFIGMVTKPEMTAFVRNGSTFSLIHPVYSTPLYDLTGDYAAARPIFDWFGVRYLVFSRRVYDPAVHDDVQALVAEQPDLTIAFADEQATVVESHRAEAKAVFVMAAQSVTDLDEVARALEAEPSAIDGPALVETPPETLAKMPPTTSRPQMPVPLSDYRPNDLYASFNAPAPGVFVVKDSYFPGWQATLDGQPVDVVRVNGMVRGVIVSSRGRHEITMQYRPTSFSLGLIVAAVSAGVLTVMLALSWARGRVSVRRHAARRPEPLLTR